MRELKPLFSGVYSEPLYIAGPCSAESREQVLSAARDIAAAGIDIFRAGVWKPRTKPGSFEGIGSKALEWLQEAKQLYGLKIITEVATPEHLEEALKSGIDGVWIGAKSTILPGISVHQGSIIGAMSLVSKSVDKNLLVAGNPMKIIRCLEDGELYD